MKRLADGTINKTKFDIAVENLIETCGFDKSESGSEAFVDLLLGCLFDVTDRIEISHASGLCWDACHDLAHELEKYSGSPCPNCAAEAKEEQTDLKLVEKDVVQ